MKAHVALLLAALLVASLTARRATAEDLFPDKNLEAAVRQEVFEKRNKLPGTLTKHHPLYLPNIPVEDIKPLAALKNLERLDLRGCGISDLSPLAGLTQWRYLFLRDNKISDLSVLVEAAKMDFEGPK